MRRLLAIILTTLVGAAIVPVPARAAAAGSPRIVTDQSPTGMVSDNDRLLYLEPTGRLILSDLTTGTQRTVASDAAGSSLALVGSYAAYFTGTGALQLQDLQSGTRVQVASSAATSPLLADGKLVWGQASAGGSEITFSLYSAADGSTKEITRLINDPPLHIPADWARFDGRYLVWPEGTQITPTPAGTPTVSTTLTALDTTTGQQRQRKFADTASPLSVSNHQVLYLQPVHGPSPGACVPGAITGYTIGLWDVGTDTVQELGTTSQGDSWGPERHGDQVYWETWTEGQGYLLHRYDLRTNRTESVPTGIGRRVPHLLNTDHYVVYAPPAPAQGLAALVPGSGLLGPQPPALPTVPPVSPLPAGAQPRVLRDQPVVGALTTDNTAVLYQDTQRQALMRYDLRTGTEQIVQPDSTLSPLTMDGPYVAYQAAGSKDDLLYLQNLRTGSRTQVPVAGGPWDPILAGGRFLWGEADLHADQEIFYRSDPTTGRRAEVTRLPANVQQNGMQEPAPWRYHPVLFDGRYLVWTEPGRLVAVNCDTGARQELVVSNLDQATSSDGGRVAYRTYVPVDRGASFQEVVRVWDLAAGTDAPVGLLTHQMKSIDEGSSAPVEQDPGPAIRGGHVVWVTWNAAGKTYDVVGYDLQTQRTGVIASDWRRKESPHLTDQDVVYKVPVPSPDPTSGMDRGLGLLFAAALTPGNPTPVPTPAPATPLPLPDRVKLWPTALLTPRFRDLPVDHWAFTAIRRVVSARLLAGYPDADPAAGLLPSFRPDSPIRRAEFLSMLMRAYPEPRPTGAAFADVPATHWAYTAIRQARGAGLVSGYPDNTFTPDGYITRAEMATLAQRFLQLPAPAAAAGFRDITGDWAWARPAIEPLKAYGLLGGFPDGTFRPGETASRAQAAALIAHLFR